MKRSIGCSMALCRTVKKKPEPKPKRISSVGQGHPGPTPLASLHYWLCGERLTAPAFLACAGQVAKSEGLEPVESSTRLGGEHGGGRDKIKGPRPSPRWRTYPGKFEPSTDRGGGKGLDGVALSGRMARGG